MKSPRINTINKSRRIRPKKKYHVVNLSDLNLAKNQELLKNHGNLVHITEN